MKRGKKARLLPGLVPALLLALFPGRPAAAQDVRGAAGVEEAVLLPPRFYVGDRVELRLHLQVREGARLEPVELVTEKEWLNVEEVRIEPRGGGEVEVKIYFVSFHPGTTTLPALRLGEVSLAGLDITTLSVLDREEDTRLRGPRGQLLLPGTAAKLAALLAAALVLPPAAFIAGRRLWAEGRRLRSRRRRRRPYLRARRELGKLRQRLAGLDSRGFFIRLSGLLKSYLSRHLDLPVLSRTTRELATASTGLPAGLWEEVTDLLRLADRAKFSRHHLTEEEMVGALERAGDLIERLEEGSHVEP